MTTISSSAGATVYRGAESPLRHPLGLPAGSVRAILAFMVLGIIWAMLLLPEQTPVAIPLYLYYLMFLILGHYFAARGHAPRVSVAKEWPPLFLPRGTIRFLILAGSVAVLAYGFYHDPHFQDRLNPPVSEQPLLLLVVMGAFFLGIIVSLLGKRMLAGPAGVPPWFQDVQASISLLAVLCLVGEYLIRLVINPGLEPDRQLSLPHWEGFLAALVAFYFGARS